MQKECELSIITINYNGLKDTCELMDTLPLDDTSLEVIVVDNASLHDEASTIAKRYPQVRVIRSERNVGFAGGNNIGMRAARGKYFFFINNDTLLYKKVEGERRPVPSTNPSFGKFGEDWCCLPQNSFHVGRLPYSVRRLHPLVTYYHA